MPEEVTEDGTSGYGWFTLKYGANEIQKLAISATYQGFDSSFGRSTATDSLSVSYRVFTRFILFANLSRSQTEESDGERTRITNLRGGLRLASPMRWPVPRPPLRLTEGREQGQTTCDLERPRE